jgi:phage-related protein
MPLPVFPPNNGREPIWTSPVNVTAKVLENEFGDGYTQRAADGINNVKETWELSWKNLTTPEKEALDNFLRERAGFRAFAWRAFGAPPKAYSCKTWKFVPTQAGYWDGSASLRQEFEAV